MSFGSTKNLIINQNYLEPETDHRSRFRDTDIEVPSAWVRFFRLCYVMLNTPINSRLSLEMTCKTGQMSIRPCERVNIFKILDQRPLGRRRWNFGCILWLCRGQNLGLSEAEFWILALRRAGARRER